MHLPAGARWLQQWGFFSVSIALVVIACGGSTACAGLLDSIGYTQLKAELGSATPTGAGIRVTQVENAYPDENSSDFSGKTFTLKDGTVARSAHATTVGGNFYGNSGSMAPGITQIDARVAYYWAGSSLLNTPASVDSGSSFAPGFETSKVENHSWVGTLGLQNRDLNLLQRLDFMIERDKVVSVVAANNGTGPLPNLLMQSYNSIAVGRSDGNHSAGYTTINGYGRVKPDIVVPLSATSYATPVVSSAAALLLDKANRAGMADASNPQVIKSVLMAGATKSQFASWNRTSSRPLDATYGAGQLNVYRSYNILAAGEQHASAAATVGSQGWDYNSSALGSRYYFFDVASGTALTELSAMLTWHPTIVDVDPSASKWTPQVSLADLNLKLYSANGFTLGSILDLSTSTVDNVEHIYFNGGTHSSLRAGRYALEVSGSSGGTPYALAWTNSSFVIGDMDGNGILGQSDMPAFEMAAANPTDYLALYPTLIDYSQRGDLNGDGRFDNIDAALAASFMNVPEPGTFALLMTGLAAAALLAARRRRRGC